MKKIIENFKDYAVKIILIMFLVMFVWTISNSILEYDIVMYIYNPLIIILGIVVYLALLIVVWKKIIPKISKNKYVPVIIILLFMYLHLFFYTSFLWKK